MDTTTSMCLRVPTRYNGVGNARVLTATYPGVYIITCALKKRQPRQCCPVHYISSITSIAKTYCKSKLYFVPHFRHTRKRILPVHLPCFRISVLRFWEPKITNANQQSIGMCTLLHGFLVFFSTSKCIVKGSNTVFWMSAIWKLLDNICVSTILIDGII